MRRKILSTLGMGTVLLLSSAVLAGGPAHAGTLGVSSTALDNYLLGMSYDKDKLLTHQGDKVTNVPPNQSEEKDGKFIVLTREKKSLSTRTADIAAVGANEDKTYPGALLQANVSLLDNNPTLISAQRAPATLSVDLPGMTGSTNSIVVKQPSTSSARAGVNTLLERWNARTATTYPTIPARIQYDETMAYSMSQLKAKFGLSFDKVASPLNIDFSGVASGDKQIQVVNFKQIYYTVSMDAPISPGAVFDASVTPEDLRARGVSNANPAAYVSSVSYGRSMYIKLETESRSTQVQAAFSAAIKGGGVSGDTEVQHILNNTSFSAVILGGDSSDATKVISGKVSDLKQIIQDGSRYGRLSPGAPISYSTSFLKDNQPATVNNTSDYVETKATEFSRGRISLQHKGWYVARYDISWDELSHDKTGKEVLTRMNWSQNGVGKTAPFGAEIHLKGNARHVKVRIQENTGLVWEGWRTIYDKEGLQLVGNRAITISGTTLQPSVAEDIQN
ncbi:thiol-activated cytolysin family protein [Streptomyces sp. NBC_01264]|uniref:thiol-activated cytolysin family protein n=1 Tax=Streptomyces sp. NBC_01264 TaxID=2903804 RepID=UPI0022509730|nr:thiol-activated cytolysin family protein [Streptomyces sp. NBC_01264]MCX4775322.1 thiol-activated cytolysin family protein [Streptomyces sp. NBC_01264]